MTNKFLTILAAATLGLFLAGSASASTATLTGSVSGPGTATNGDAVVCSDSTYTTCGSSGITVSTDANGNVQFFPKAGCVTGVYTVTASAIGQTVTGTFTVNPGPIAAITLKSGSGQSVFVKGKLLLPFVFSATDVCGNVIF